MKKLLPLLLVLLINNALCAQSDSVEVDSNVVAKLLNMESRPPVAGIEYELSVANDDISFKSILQFAFSDFLDEGDKSDIVVSLIERSRLGYQQHFEIFYDQPAYEGLEKSIKNGYRFSIKNDVYSAISFPAQAAQLFLYGNKRFAGETVVLSDSRYEDWWYTSLNYQQDFTLDSLPMRASFAIVLGHTYSTYNLNKVEIFTEENGEYIDADLNYELLRTDYEDQIIKLGGMGFSTGLATNLKLSPNYNIDLELSDLGLIYWSNLTEVKVDSTFRFSGIEFDNIFDINDSLINRENEKIRDGLFFEKGASKAVLMPFNFRAQLNKKVSYRNIRNFFGFVNYRYLVGYIPEMGIGINFDFMKKEKHLLRTQLTYGGFNTLSFGAYYTTRLGDNFMLKLGSSNILAFALPSVATGSSVAVALHYTF